MSKIKVDEIESQSGSTVTITGSPSISGDISVANVNASQDVTATGDVSGANVSATTDVSTGTVTATGAISGASAAVTGAISGASATVTGAVSADTVSATTSVDTATVTATDVNSTNVTATGAVSGDTVSGTTSVTTATVNATTGAITTVNATDVNSTDVTATGTVSANAVSSTTSVSGASASITGDVSAGTFTGDGSALTGVTKANQDLDTTDDVNFNTVTAVGAIIAGSFSGDGSGLTGVSGATEGERRNINELLIAQARDDYDRGITLIDMEGGQYDIFADTSKVATSDNVGFATLDGGATTPEVSVTAGTFTLAADGVSGDEVFTDVSGANSAQFTEVNGNGESLDISRNGLYVYMGDSTGGVRAFQLSSPYDFSSYTSLYQNDFITNGQQSVYDIRINDDGTLLTFATSGDESTNGHYVLDLNTPYDPSGGFSQTFIPNTTAYSYIGGFDPYPLGVCFSPDGTYLYISESIFGSSSDRFRNGSRMTMSTPFDFRTRSGPTRYTFPSHPFSPTNVGWRGCHYVSSDGTKLIQAFQGSAFVFNVPTPFDLSSITSNDGLGGAGFSGRAETVTTDDLYLLAHDFNSNRITAYQVSSTRTDGNFTSNIDLTNELPNNPKSVVVTSEFNLPTGATFEIRISDGTNTVTIPSTSFDTLVDCSTLTSRNLTATFDLEGADVDNLPTLQKYALYFA